VGGRRARKQGDDYYTGRWLTQDPLGIDPSGGKHNRFRVLHQYNDSLSLYEYVNSNTLNNLDPKGLVYFPWADYSCGICGLKMSTSEFESLEKKLKKQLDDAIATDPNSKDEICKGMYHHRGWDWVGVHDIETHQSDNCGCGGYPLRCKGTIEINGKCYNAHEVNYYLWGLANRLCGHKKEKAIKWARRWATWRPQRAYCKVRWTEAGYDGKVSVAAGCTWPMCKTGKCKFSLRGTSPYVRKISDERPYRYKRWYDWLFG